MKTSMARVENPASVLPYLKEQSVQRFEYKDSERIFELICHFPKKVRGGDPIFFLGRFGGVERFRRLEGDLAAFKDFTTSYQAGPGIRPIVIQSLTYPHADEIEFWFGANFGGVAFAFTSLEAFTRESSVKEVGRDFIYSDSVSGVEFDFYHPFDGLG